MNPLNFAIQEAFKSLGNSKEANKAYLEFIKANFIIPIEKTEDTEEPRVLFIQEEQMAYLPVFTEREYLHAWATEISTEINVLNLSGVDLLKGLGDEVKVCLDIGTEFYKEFDAGELARMKGIILKFFHKDE